MSFLSFKFFGDNYFSENGDYNILEQSQDNKEFNTSFLFPVPSFYQEEHQPDIRNSDFLYKDIDLNEEMEEYDFKQIESIKNEEKLESEDEKQQSPNKDKQRSSTEPTSDKKGEINIKKVVLDKFKVQQNDLPNYWRFDMAKKHFKTQISEYGTILINELIQKSDLPKELKKPIHKPNSLKFTSNVKVTDNKKFLNDTIRTILTIGKENFDLQKQNEENIANIYKYFGKFGYDKLSEDLRKIKDFFEMNYEDLIRKFYDSFEFRSFKEDEKSKFFDEGTIKQEGFSLFENYGLITVFRALNKKRKRD